MKKTEAIQLLTVISTAYPGFQITEPTVDLWGELLSDIDFKLAKVALKKMILESPYPPTIADIRKQVAEISSSDGTDGAEAWGQVIKAIHRFGYYRQEEALKSLPPRAAKVARLMGWQEICTSPNPDVIRGQFLKMYQQIEAREEKQQLLPQSLKDYIQKIARKFMLEGEKNDSKMLYLQG